MDPYCGYGLSNSRRATFCCVRNWPGIFSAGSALKNGFGTERVVSVLCSYPYLGSMSFSCWLYG
jgi:hypothetical protein